MKLIDAERRALEQEVNVLIKLAMDTMEELAASDPTTAQEPVRFNEIRTHLIRACWNTVKHAIQFGQLVRESS